MEFTRLLAHLSKPNKCAKNIDLNEFKAYWTKFSGRKRYVKFDLKKKEENKDKFLKEHAARQRKCEQDKKDENKDKFLKEQAAKKRKYDQDKKVENKDKFLKEQAARKRKCDQDKIDENKDRFLKEQAARKRKCDQNKKAQNQDQFRKDKGIWNRKAEHKKKTKNKAQFLKDQNQRRKKCNQEKIKKVNADERFRRYRRAIMFGPIFVCRCCKRKLFEHQVIKVDMTNFREIVETNTPGLFSRCIQSHSEPDGNEHQTGMVVTSYDIDKMNFVCKGCKGSMQRGQRA